MEQGRRFVEVIAIIPPVTEAQSGANSPQFGPSGRRGFNNRNRVAHSRLRGSGTEASFSQCSFPPRFDAKPLTTPIAFFEMRWRNVETAHRKTSQFRPASPDSVSVVRSKQVDPH